MAAWVTEPPTCQAYPHPVFASSAVVASTPPQTVIDHNENYTYGTPQYIPGATLYEEPVETEISTVQYPVQESDPQAPIRTWQPRTMPRHPDHVQSAVTSSSPSMMDSFTSIDSGGSSFPVPMMASSCTTNASGDVNRAAPSLANFTQMGNDPIPLFNAHISEQRAFFQELPYHVDTARVSMEFGGQASPPLSVGTGLMGISHGMVNERHPPFYSSFQPPRAASAVCHDPQSYHHHWTPRSTQTTQEPLSNTCPPTANHTPMMDPQLVHYCLAQGSHPKQAPSTYPKPSTATKCDKCNEVHRDVSAPESLAPPALVAWEAQGALRKLWENIAAFRCLEKTYGEMQGPTARWPL